MEQRTYAQSLKAGTFDWNAFLQKESYTLEELDETSACASSWVTCACGNQCALIPRAGDGKPFDTILSGLGVTFMEYIDGMYMSYRSGDDACFYNNQQKAIRILQDIEKRSAQLLQELDKKEAS